MCDVPEMPEDVADEEYIARIVSSPSMVANGRVSPTAFKLRKLKSGPETYVSVWRLSYGVPTKENAAHIKFTPGDELFGYASIKAGECRALSFGGITLDVKAYPTKAYPFHAGICFSKGTENIKGVCKDIAFINITKILANQCELVAI